MATRSKLSLARSSLRAGNLLLVALLLLNLAAAFVLYKRPNRFDTSYEYEPEQRRPEFVFDESEVAPDITADTAPFLVTPTVPVVPFPSASSNEWLPELTAAAQLPLERQAESAVHLSSHDAHASRADFAARGAPGRSSPAAQLGHDSPAEAEQFSIAFAELSTAAPEIEVTPVSSLAKTHGSVLERADTHPIELAQITIQPELVHISELPVLSGSQIRTALPIAQNNEAGDDPALEREQRQDPTVVMGGHDPEPSETVTPILVAPAAGEVQN